MKRDDQDLLQQRILCAITFEHFLNLADNPQDGPARVETRKVPIPPHRMTPLKAAWPKM